MGIVFHIGRYFLLLRETFSHPERPSLYWKRTVEEMDLLGVKSLGIVALLSVFMGAVITIQTSSNIDAAWIPSYVVGFTARQSTILEFSPTIISLILAGKVGSNIAAEIGSMRVKEQIDALDIMGVNSAGYLILPKIDVCYLLRMQRERMTEALVPSLREYTATYGLTRRRAALLDPAALVMHPGPMNRGVEIAAEVSDLPTATMVEQVANGVAVRMAVLFLLLGSGTTDEAARVVEVSDA